MSALKQWAKKEKFNQMEEQSAEITNAMENIKLVENGDTSAYDEAKANKEAELTWLADQTAKALSKM
jgi:hypothetical protein